MQKKKISTVNGSLVGSPCSQWLFLGVFPMAVPYAGNGHWECSEPKKLLGNTMNQKSLWEIAIGNPRNKKCLMASTIFCPSNFSKWLSFCHAQQLRHMFVE
jgi:hypothetical protein